MLIEVLAALSLGVQSAPQATQNGPQAQTTAATTQAASDQESTPEQQRSRVVCQRVQETGSNRYRRVCQTEGAIEHQRDRAQRLMNDVMDTRPTAPGETEQPLG